MILENFLKEELIYFDLLFRKLFFKDIYLFSGLNQIRISFFLLDSVRDIASSISFFYESVK